MTAPMISAISFSSYELYKTIRGKTELSYWDGLENGTFAGLIISFIVTPTELIKCTMQMDSHNRYKNSKDCLNSIIKKHGFSGIYKGFVPTLLREVPSYAFQFATYEFLKKKFIGKDK
jgi:solute carrier family 25 carnitine/acylcarnitine transporter 20/29